MIFFSGRKKERNALNTLEGMSQSPWRCRTCDETHTGIFDLGTASPSVWLDEEVIESNSALRLDGNFLSEDFCIVNGESFIVRCVLKFQVKGLENGFGFGVWSSLSEDNFKKYLEVFDDGIKENEYEWSSWFCSDLSYFGKTVGEKAWVIPQPKRQRPHILLMDENSVLGRAHRQTMSASTLLEIFEYYGHSPE